MQCTNTNLNQYRNPRLPDTFVSDTVYRLTPNNPDEAYYRSRTDRNIGWISEAEQQMLRQSTVAIAGCGGMGGQLAEKLLRLGIGEIRIADRETFDPSNINRQFAALRSTVGKSKAWETARLLRQISDDTTLVVYPQGICERTVRPFIAGADVIADEIEFWAIGSRLLLHNEARQARVALFNCNTIGFGTHLFLYSPDCGATIEDCLGISYEAACSFEERLQAGTTTASECTDMMSRISLTLFPAWPEYSSGRSPDAVQERLLKEHKGSILATNPPLATGFLADRILLHLLRNSGVKRSYLEIPPMPGYVYLDAATLSVKICRRQWW